MTDSGLAITRVVDLQIVNGGQTTASLFHTRKRDKADLSQIFVQLKLSVIDSLQSETVVPRISEYANTQNRVNRSEEHTSELQSLMRISYAVFCLKKKKITKNKITIYTII